MPSRMKHVTSWTAAVFLAAIACGEIAVNIDDGALPPRPGASVSPPPPSNGKDAERLRPALKRDDRLVLINGDSLRGTLVSVDPAGYGLRWIHPSANDPIDFALDAVAQVKLDERPTSGRRAGDARITLTNDDLLSGRLMTLDAEALSLDTWYAGPLTIQRPMLRTLEPNLATSPLVYQGPAGLERWTLADSARGQWMYKNGALYASTSYAIGKGIEGMPDKVSIQFDAAWQYNYPSFYFSFFSDNLTSYSGNCYALRVNGTSVYLYRFSSRGGSQRLANINVQEFSQQRNATFRLLADRKERLFTLLINGHVKGRWSDGSAAPGVGNGIVFDPENEYPFKISNITVCRWDGTVPTPGDDSMQETEEDTVRFVNEDKVSGNLQSIADGNATFETSYATLEIPLERAVRIDMSSRTTARARRNRTDLRAHFATKGVVTVALTGIERDVVKGSSENFGAIEMPLGAFGLLEFNIYRDRSAEEADEREF